MFCSKCGTQQTPSGRVCIKCNAPLSSTAKLDIASIVPPTQIQQSNQYPNQNFNSGQPLQNSPPPPQASSYQPPNQPAPPPWSSQMTEQDRVKMVYPTAETAGSNNYIPGQYLQPFAPNYPINPNAPYPPYGHSRQTASKRAIWGMVFSVLSFAFCPIFSAAIGVFLSSQELLAIEQGLAPLEGKPLAQIGYYLGMANICLYGIGLGLFILFVFV